ncbi:hypothetical protein ACFV42_23385 [Streptomyces solisilvae]|uniref:hypothetical protein n=1 Tax=Streptomyces malaysiensis TaxID=92644 RepID=UPI00368CE24B
MLKKLTAAELAWEFAKVRQLPPHLTGPLSMLDEAASGWSQRYPHLIELSDAFAQARSYHNKYRRRDMPTEQTWQKLVATADDLAVALQELGNIHLERCNAQSGWGETCGSVLQENGSCRSSEEHMSNAPEEWREGCSTDEQKARVLRQYLADGNPFASAMVHDWTTNEYARIRALLTEEERP